MELPLLGKLGNRNFACNLISTEINDSESLSLNQHDIGRFVDQQAAQKIDLKMKMYVGTGHVQLNCD